MNDLFAVMNGLFDANKDMYKGGGSSSLRNSVLTDFEDEEELMLGGSSSYKPAKPKADGISF